MSLDGGFDEVEESLRRRQLSFQFFDSRQRRSELFFQLRYPLAQPLAIPTFALSHLHDATTYPLNPKFTYTNSPDP